MLLNRWAELQYLDFWCEGLQGAELDAACSAETISANLMIALTPGLSFTPTP